MFFSSDLKSAVEKSLVCFIAVGTPQGEDGSDFILHRVTYNIEKVGKLMDNAGFNGYYYGCLKTAAKNLCW